MSGTYGLQGLADEDLQVYSFDELNAGNDNLAGLLDEDSNAFNDETFGDVFSDEQPVGRDFDFAGNTNKFLGTDAATTAGLQPSKPSSSSSASPWTSLNDDPLLSKAPSYAPPVQPAPARQMKTLEEVEAEMRQAAASRPPPPPPQGARPMTVEEVEAEMLLKARQQAAAPPAQPAQVQQQQQQQQQPPAVLPPGASPRFQSPFPPGVPPPSMFPPDMPPQMKAMIYQQMQQQQQFAQQQGRPGSTSFPPLPPPPGMMPGPGGAQASPLPMPQHLPLNSNTAFPPLGSVPSPPSAAQGANLMATLFPGPQAQQQQQAPLPFALQPTTNLAQVEQQLHFLSLNQHVQHPSLTSAQLQSLLQQAHHHHHQASGGKAAEGGEGGEKEDAEKEAEEKKKAGEELIRKVEMRIMEHERLEAMRKKKAMKIASMAKHNNLMSNSDKDFITRIQVSQLITDDPYADDFYFHIMAAIKNARQNAILAAINQGNQQQPGLPVPGAPPVGAAQATGGNSNNNRRPTKRENAMNRMAQNVQRLVDSAKKRNANTPNTLSLDGALGKIATRTRSAPRPLLQVKSSSMNVVPSASSGSNAAPSSSSPPPPRSGDSPDAGESLLTGAGLISTSAGTDTTLPAPAASGPLSHRDALALIEKLYDTVLDLEQLRRIQPSLVQAEQSVQEQFEQMTVEGEVKQQMKERCDEARVKVEAGEAKYEELRERLWEGLRIMDPLDACVPHPFISILSILKGKRLLPRAIRHLSPEQTLTLLTLLVATFETLDVVVDAPLLDQLDTTGFLEAKQRRLAVEAKTEALLNAIIAPVMQVVGGSQLRMVTGMLGLLMDRNDLESVLRSKPGLAFLTILLSRAESLNQSTPAPEETDLVQWQRTFSYLFSILSPSLLSLFPSTRMARSVPFGIAQYQSVDALRPQVDLDDEPVWRFLASVAVCADPEQQQVLVTGVRDKVIEGVRGAKMGKGGPEVAAIKIRNVNLLLHALSLDASMIETDE